MEKEPLSAALAAYNKGNLKKSLSIIEKKKLTSFDASKLQLKLLFELEKYSQAVTLGQKLLQFNSGQEGRSSLLFYVAVCAAKSGNCELAISLLEQSIALDSSINNAQSLTSLMSLYYQQSHYEKAKQLALKLAKYQAHFINAHMYLIRVAKVQADKKQIIRSAVTLIDAISDLPLKLNEEVLLALISANELLMVEKALLKLSDERVELVRTIKMAMASKNKQWHELIALVDSAPSQRQISPFLLYHRADALHGLKNYDHAYANYQQAAQQQIKYQARTQYKDELPLWNKLVDKIEPGFTAKQKQISSVNPEQPNLLFIFSFPRSGTTLIDNVLDTQDYILDLSEVGIVSNLVAKAKTMVKRFPAQIYSLSELQQQELRDYYYELVAQIAPNYQEKRLIVDKGPHHTTVLPLLSLIFPQAKFLAAIRHPMDVCFSCFQQNFELNEPNSYLTTMENTVERYNAVMTLLQRYQNELDLNVYELKYEDLVVNFEETMKALFDYLDLPVENELSKFHEKAGDKFVTSASSGQTNQALYQSSLNKWQHYESQLTPFFAKLEPFIKKYGYT